MWGIECRNDAGQVTFDAGDSSVMLIGSITETGKTASTPGNADGWRTVTVPDVPSDTSIWCMMTLIDGAGTLAAEYESSSQLLSASQFRYRIDRAATGAITIIEYGWR